MYNSKYLLPKILLYLCKASPLTMSTTNFIKHDTYTFLVMQTKGKPCSKYRQIMSSFYLHGNCFYQVHGCCFVVFISCSLWQDAPSKNRFQFSAKVCIQLQLLLPFTLRWAIRNFLGFSHKRKISELCRKVPKSCYFNLCMKVV